MKASIFESRKPQAAITEAELAAQKAAFFATGGKSQLLPPQFFAKDQAEKQTYTVIANGRPKSRGMQ